MFLLYASAFLFTAIHLLPSTPVRRASVTATGEGVYLGVFSVLSLGALWWLTDQFKIAPYGEKLWNAGPIWIYVKSALVLFAFILGVAGLTAPNPSLTGAGKALNNENTFTGILAITRHPLMWGIAIWAVCHIVTQATPRGIAFFGSLAVTALLGAYLQERRKRATLGAAWAAFENQTSFIPFAALLEGRARLRLRHIGWWRIGLAVVLWAVVFQAHAWIFGVSPIAALT